MKSVDIVVEREDGWSQGFRVSRGVDLGSKEVRIYLHDFASGANGETCSRLRGMDPDTARRVAAELSLMADHLEYDLDHGYAPPQSGEDKS